MQNDKTRPLVGGDAGWSFTWSLGPLAPGPRGPSTSFANNVPVPRRDFRDDARAAVRHTLARQARTGRDAVGLVETVFLVLVRRVTGLAAATDYHVAGRARANAAAGMVDLDSVGQGDVEQAAGPAVAAVRGAGGVDFERVLAAVRVDERDSEHGCTWAGESRFPEGRGVEFSLVAWRATLFYRDWARETGPRFTCRYTASLRARRGCGEDERGGSQVSGAGPDYRRSAAVWVRDCTSS